MFRWQMLLGWDERAATCQVVPQRAEPSGADSGGVELPGDEAIIRREGERLVIEPVRKRGLLALLASMTPTDEAWPEIEDGVPDPVRGTEIFGGLDSCDASACNSNPS
jgi:virulence-associated protein VagC